MKQSVPFYFLTLLIIYMIYTINQLRQEILGNIYNVYEIFQNFFGEQYTDLQGIPTDEDIANFMSNYPSVVTVTIAERENCYDIQASTLREIKRAYSSLTLPILVWWPRVTITNENDRSVVIHDLYAKIEVTAEGRIPYHNRGFQLNRTTFTEEQFSCGYLHSHIPHFSGVPHFDNPCLGSGPINNTILDLKNGYEDTLWLLFCQEMSLYVTVESLRGGPYFRMETIGSRTVLSEYSGYRFEFDHLANTGLYGDSYMELVAEFLPYYLKNGHLALSYKEGTFVPGMPYFDYIIDISNAFIDFFNSKDASFRENNKRSLFERGLLKEALIAEGKFYRTDVVERRADSSSFEGSRMFTFKGEMQHLHIIAENAHTEPEKTIILSHRIAMCILQNILKVINYRFTNEHNRKQDSGEAASSTYQTVCYI